MKVPEGTPGKDNYYFGNVCHKCNRHFLIADEVAEHIMICIS